MWDVLHISCHTLHFKNVRHLLSPSFYCRQIRGQITVSLFAADAAASRLLETNALWIEGSQKPTEVFLFTSGRLKLTM